METYTAPKKLVKNDAFQTQRQKALAGLNDDMIDQPIIDLVNGFNTLDYCFTLQSCFGHFLYKNQTDINNLDPLPLHPITGRIEYRIAYIALCIENSLLGRILLDRLEIMCEIAPEYIQFCSADWFWERQHNSYAIQVIPDRFKDQDRAILDYEMAAKTEEIRDMVFVQMRELLSTL